MNYKIIPALLLTAFLSSSLVGLQAQIPSTDIFVADIIVKDGKYTFSTPVNITNRKGYDNQPAFSPSGKIMYTSLRDTGGTDIYQYDPANGKDTRITKTPESEYSPTLMPGGKSWSVVRVDKDSLQRLYEVSPDGNKIKLLIKNQDSIGYHCWISNNLLAVFVLGDTATLRMINVSTGETETVASGIGRCIAKIPGTQQVSYVEKRSEKEWYIKAWYPDTKKEAYLVQTLEGCEDYVWTKDKKLLMGKDGKLYSCDPYTAQPWKEIADFTAVTGTFYRLAINEAGTKIAFVSYSGTKP